MSGGQLEDDFCEAAIRYARRAGLSFAEGAIAFTTLGVVMQVISVEQIGEEQLRTIQRELIENAVLKMATPVAGKAVRH